jgi:hypothetical protein
MTVEQIKEAKKTAESKIVSAIVEFEDISGFSVTGVSVDKLYVQNAFSGYSNMHFTVSLEVKL